MNSAASLSPNYLPIPSHENEKPYIGEMHKCEFMWPKLQMAHVERKAGRRQKGSAPPFPKLERASLASKGQVRTRVITQKKKTTDTRNNESSCVRPEDGLHLVTHNYLQSGRWLKSPVRNYMQMERYRRAVWRIRDLIRMFRANPEVQKLIPIP